MGMSIILYTVGVVFLLVCIICIKKPKIRIVNSVLFCLLLGAGLFMAASVAPFFDRGSLYIILIVVFFAAIIGLLVLLNIKKKSLMFIPGIVAGLCAGILAASIGYEIYDHQIPGVYEDLHFYRYRPYVDNNKLATVSGPVSLQLEDDFPRLDGATALYPLYAAFYQSVYPITSWTADDLINCSKTAGAYQNLIEGNADIIFCARPSREQMEEARARGVSFSMVPIGKDAFVFFVNKRNPVKGLSSGQIRRIYSGEITNWKKLGGSYTRIKVYQRNENSGSQAALRRFMGDTPLMEARTERVSAMGTMIEILAEYKNYKSAIGYSFLFYTEEMVRNDKIRLLAVDGVIPTRESIQDGTYPLANDFYAITLGNESPHTKALIGWILSDQGQELVAKTGYTPIR